MNFSIDSIYEYLIENLSIEMVLKFMVAYFFIIWIAALVWVIKDITNRTSNIFLQLVSILFILIFTPLWIFLYLLVRPGRTLFEKYYDEVETNLSCLKWDIEKNINKKEKIKEIQKEVKESILKQEKN